MRVGLVTSRSARRLVEEVARGLDGEVEIIEVPVPVISFLSTTTLAKIIEARSELREKLSRVDVIVIPGRVKGDAEPIEKVTGRPVYKGPKDLGLIPAAVRHLLSGGSLDRARPAEQVMGSVTLKLEPTIAFRIGRVEVPSRGPPVLVVTEIHPGVEEGRVASEARRHLSDGARIILVGAGDGVSPESLARRIEAVAATGAPGILAEAPSRRHAKAALDAGAHGISTSPDTLGEVLDLLPSDAAVLLGDRDLGRLESGLDLLRIHGVDKVVLDPVLGLPLIDLAESIGRYREAHRLGAPLLFTAANVTEEVEADPHGVHAVLAALAVELGASLYLVVEETYKSTHGTAEAAEALRLASEAWARRSTPRGLYSRLYVARQPVKPPQPPRVEAEAVYYVEPRIDKRGYIEVHVDHDRGVIRAVYRRLPSLEVEAAVEGVHPNSIARALIRKVGLDPEHAAYLGAELAKAHIALRLGLTYTQDEPVVTPVWEKVRSVEGGGEQSC